MYYHKFIVNLRKTTAEPLYELHLFVDTPPDGKDLQTYAQNVTENYIIAAHRLRYFGERN